MLHSVEARLVSGLRAGCLRVQAPHPHRPGRAQRGVRRPRAVDCRVLLPRPPPETTPSKLYTNSSFLDVQFYSLSFPLHIKSFVLKYLYILTAKTKRETVWMLDMSL